MMNSRPTRNNKKKQGRFLQAASRLISNRVFIAILSVIAAIIIWGIMMSSDGTLTRRKVFTSVPVSVTGETTMISRGYIVTDNILSMVPTVDMVIETTQSNYARANSTSYNPHFELTQVTGEGENTLSIVYSSQAYGQVISCEPNTITVHAERYITRRIPVLVTPVGDLPEGVYLKSYRSDPTYLSVSGPISTINTILRASVLLDQSMLSAERMTDRLSLSIELQATDGSVVESDKVTVTNQSVITSSVIVETELIPVKSIALDGREFVSGEPAEGFELTGVELGNDTIHVAAAQEILDAITAITTDEPMSIAGATEDVTGYVRLRRLTGIESTLPTEMAVTARIAEKTISRTIRSVNITAKGQGGSTVTLSPSRINVRFTGPYTKINTLAAGDISLYVDVTDLENGTYYLPLEVVADNLSEYTAEPDDTIIQVVVKTR